MQPVHPCSAASTRPSVDIVTSRQIVRKARYLREQFVELETRCLKEPRNNNELSQT